MTAPETLPDDIPKNRREWRPQLVKRGRYVPTVVDPILEPLWTGTRVLVNYRDSVNEDEWGDVVVLDEYGDDAIEDAPIALDHLRRSIMASEAVIDGRPAIRLRFSVETDAAAGCEGGVVAYWLDYGVDNREAGKLLAPRSAAYYDQLKLGDRFQHLVFEGGHEFHDESAWEFVKKHL